MGIGLLGRESQQRWSDFLLLGGLLPVATAEKNGLMSIRNYRRMGRSFSKGYYKLAESSVWYYHYNAFIYGASPASTDGVLIAINWSGPTYSATRINGINAKVKLFTGDNPDTGKHELWLGLIGVDGVASEFIIRDGTAVDMNSGKFNTLPSYLSEIVIS